MVGLVAASYDYSSVLYLNSKGHSFDGGDFCFIDEDGDSTLEPRIGRSANTPPTPDLSPSKKYSALGWAVVRCAVGGAGV